MDSATLHLCGTTSTPSFSLFGPSSASIYKPLGEHHVAFQGSCPYGRTFVKRCPILRTCKTGACMKDLTAKRIFQDLEKFLSMTLSVNQFS
jgi:heptosyltransferase-1